MGLPKFLLADNSDLPETMFIVHTEFPRFVLNLETDEVEWLEEFSPEDQDELETETARLIEEATAFYDREVSRYDV
jgi:hypothetical protein